MGRRNGYTYNYTSSLTADYILENTNFSDGKALKVVSASSETKPRLANIAGSIPVVVLVDGTTASAAEMISGAFQDNKRASIIGGITYGKGLLQRGWLFNNGTSLFVTVGNWYTPKGDSVSQRGIIPDYRVNKEQLHATAIRVLKQGK
jgi:C-terminal processing protease CtpA/Prc